MKHLATVLAILLGATFLGAQKSNAIYGELLGNGLFGSVNYDFAPIKKNKAFRLKVGIGNAAYPILITQVNYLLGGEKHFVEIGAGINVFSVNDDQGDLELFLAPTGAFQYRFEHPRGFLFRAGLAPIFFTKEQAGSSSYQLSFLTFPGMSLGYAF